MKNKQGTFIVIEGTDGSGKGTQFKKLVERLEENGYDVATFDFPQYDQSSSYFVKEYLNGKYGTADAVGPYTASLFYALDRYEAAPAIRQALDAGKVVIANRFTGSNMAHQGTKFSHHEQRRGYFIWLDSLEYQMLGIPRPNQNIVLRVPANIAQELVDHKEARSYTDKKRDIHEADLSHLERSVEVYDDLCHLFPKDFTRIDCVRGGKLLSIDEVSKLVWEKIEPLLPEVPAKTEGRKHTATPDINLLPKEVYIPEMFDTATASAYKKGLAALLEKRASILRQLMGSPESAKQTGQLLLPVAAVAAQSQSAKQIILQPENPVLESIANKELPQAHSRSDNETVHLVEYWPRNESSIVAKMLYPFAEASLAELDEAIDKWPYAQKADAVGIYANEPSYKQPALLHYTFDALIDGETFIALADSLNGQLRHQPLTPRYGYVTPDELSSMGLSEDFDACYDLSMQMYSQLQSAGYVTEAQFVTLLGHKVRILVNLNEADITRLQGVESAKLQTFAKAVVAEISTVHPLFAEKHS